MEKAILDFTGCKYYSEFHKRIQEALQFPEYYGKNWSAFWDSLMWESPVEYVEIYGEHTLPDEWKPQIEKMHEIIEEVKTECRKRDWEFDYVIID